MKRLYFFVLLIFLSCSNDSKTHYVSTNIKINFSDTFSIPLDSLSSPPNISKGCLIDGKRYFMYLNKSYNTIYVQEINNNSNLLKIRFDIEGPKGIGPISFFDFDENTLKLYLVSKNRFKLYEASLEQKMILKTYSLLPKGKQIPNGPIKEFDYSDGYLEPNRMPIIFNGNSLFISGVPPLAASEDIGKYLKYTNLDIKLSSLNSQVELISKFPDNTSANDGKLPLKSYRPKRVFNEDKILVYSFQNEDNVFLYDTLGHYLGRKMLKFSKISTVNFRQDWSFESEDKFYESSC